MDTRLPPALWEQTLNPSLLSLAQMLPSYLSPSSPHRLEAQIHKNLLVSRTQLMKGPPEASAAAQRRGSSSGPKTVQLVGIRRWRDGGFTVSKERMKKIWNFILNLEILNTKIFRTWFFKMFLWFTQTFIFGHYLLV